VKRKSAGLERKARFLRSKNAPKKFTRAGFAVLWGLAVLLLPGASGLWAEEKGPDYVFTYSASLGLLYGQGEEIVYKNGGGDTYLSELLWDLKPLFYHQSVLDFGKARPLEGPGFWGSFSLRLGIPAFTGIMEDRDWLNPQEDFLTQYSRHDAHTDSLLSTELRAGFSTPVLSRFVFKFFLGVSYMEMNWTGWDGYYQYRLSGTAFDNSRPWDDSLPRQPVYGPQITYRQRWIAVFPGLSLGASFSRRFSWELSAVISPLVYGAARDVHLRRAVQFDDYLSGGVFGGFFGESRGDLVFSLARRIDLAFHLTGRLVKGQRGSSTTTSLSTGDASPSSDNAGAGYFFLDAGLSVKMRLQRGE
jgi:outer membrane protease